MPLDADVRAYEAVLQHPRAPDLATIAQSLMTAAVQVRRFDGRPDHVAKLAAEMRLSRDDGATQFGNALDVLARGPEDDAQRALACALAARALGLFPPKDHEEQVRVASELLWLGAHTPFDATGLIDAALGEMAGGLWDAIAERVRAIDGGALGGVGRGEALVGASALACSIAPGAPQRASWLAAEVHDRRLARVLGAARPTEPVEAIAGEMTSPPRGTVVTTLLALTGMLLVVHAGRLFGKLALAYRQPAQVTLLEDGDRGAVRVRWRVEILGRTLRDRDVVVPRASLLRAGREVRFPRLALYAALLSLALGSYVGASAFVDGVRAASPSLLLTGLVVVALGIGLDFALSSLVPAARGTCRVLFVARDGAALCVDGVETERADSVLARLAGT